MAPGRNPDVVSDLVEDRAVLVDPAGTELITLNAVGTLVWDALDGRRDLPDLCRVVLDRYPSMPAAQVEADVRSFLDELSSLGLLSDGSPPG
ncbi:MAG TPA: PqqD family protein [Acidimicrobiia bacterium]|nr:PqqD family protein [Acidimicrobiia bacterium]